jgi:hypothetical protein
VATVEVEEVTAADPTEVRRPGSVAPRGVPGVRALRSMAPARQAAHRVNPDELDAYETDLELSLYREYRDVVRLYRYVVETERRFYLCNEVEVTPTRARTCGSSCTSPTRGCGTCTARPGSSRTSGS